METLIRKEKYRGARIGINFYFFFMRISLEKLLIELEVNDDAVLTYFAYNPGGKEISPVFVSLYRK